MSRLPAFYYESALIGVLSCLAKSEPASRRRTIFLHQNCTSPTCFPSSPLVVQRFSFPSAHNKLQSRLWYLEPLVPLANLHLRRHPPGIQLKHQSMPSRPTQKHNLLQRVATGPSTSGRECVPLDCGGHSSGSFCQNSGGGPSSDCGSGGCSRPGEGPGCECRIGPPLSTASSAGRWKRRCGCRSSRR